MLTIDEIKSAVEKVGKKYGIKDAYLFGSYAKGTATEDSDVDILINRGDIHTYRQYFGFYQDLKNELAKEVDVSAEDGMYPQILHLVEKYRIPLYAA